MKLSATDVRTTCAVPSPKIAWRIAHSRFGRSSSPIRKQQQDDTELGEMQNLLGIALGEQGADAKGSKQHAGDQIPENGGYSEPARQRRCQRQRRQQDGQFVESHSVPLSLWARKYSTLSLQWNRSATPIRA